jgi:microcystin-dependent protein
MADVTISELTNRQPNSSAVFPYSEGGVTYNATLNQIIPTGVIMMWSGSIASVPSGWALCNGTNGTPNLVDRFVVGAGVTTPAVGTTGGSKDAIVVSHTHAVTDPGHSHTAQLYDAGVSGVGAFRSSNPQYAKGTPSTSSATTGITIAAAGSSGTNANLPPYYALAYIMKL